MSGSYAYMNEAGLCRTVVLQEGGLKLGSCITLGNELSEETHVLTMQEILLGKGTCMENSREREPRRTALPRGSQSRVLW